MPEEEDASLRPCQQPEEANHSTIDVVPICKQSVKTEEYFMLNFSSHLQWFQAKIGSYDKQIWETSVEQRILQGLENRPKREGSLHKELIDIDLVRGSTFSKAKPRHGLKSVIFNGLKKVIFFPYYFNQWQDHFNKEVVYFFLFHYIIQLVQLTLYFMWSNSTEIMLEEIFLPIILALSLGVLHAHIIAPYSVKQRRHKTLSSSNSKTKSGSNAEGTAASLTVANKVHSNHMVAPSQPTDLLHQESRDKSNCDLIHTCQENSIPGRPQKKSMLFRKSTLQNSELSDEGDPKSVEKKSVQPEGYEGENEAKDSSSSEREEIVDNEAASGMKMNETVEPGCPEEVCGAPLPKTISKRVKISDHGERSTTTNKIKSNIARLSLSEVVTVTDEEDLKKFITAKNKQIPDPTPIHKSKKDKDKVNWKAVNAGANQKSYKSSKSRRPNIDWVGTNSGVSSGNVSASNVQCNCAAPSAPEGSKNNKSAITESTTIGSADGTNENVPLNGNVTNQDTITDHSSSDQKSISGTTQKIVAKSQSIISVVHEPLQQKISQSVSQPHTPINHAGSRFRGRIEVRKVSSADASPTPSRRNSSSFGMLGSITQELGQKPCKQTPPNNQKESNNNRETIQCLPEGANIVFGSSMSSEEHSMKTADLNEDTITKSHKKREEFKQLFVMKAQASLVEKVTNYNSAGKSVSSSSSSRNSATGMKHSKVKRRHRDDCKLVTGETFLKHKHRKEMVQSMSETEYDRMNSDVNSTGNSTSDGEEICPSVGAVKTKTKDQEKLKSKEENYENLEIIEIGGSVNIAGKNDNNTIAEEANRPVQSWDILHPEMAPDDPFLLWYKEAHTPGSLYGMTGSVSCYIWEKDELKKTNLSLLDIGWSIIQAVERHEQDKIYSSFGFFIIISLCFTPLLFRVYVNRSYIATVVDMTRHSNMFNLLPQNGTFIHSLITAVNINTSLAVTANKSNCHLYSWTDDIMPLALTSILASEWPIRFIIIIGVILRMTLYTMTFLMLCVAENSFEQRLQYAKHFCRLTSSRRARKYYLPHFRLNKLANIKCWLSLRSYLKKRGPQRSVESIISSAFYMLLAMLSLVCVNLLQSSENLFINRLINWDLVLCSVALGIFMMRFLVLGTKITKKYRNLSVIITEQINLFLAMQTRPHKKEELTLAHNVLRLAESLLKEVEGPFRICGWSMNPFLYNILKVVILSVFSTVLSESCGFKMKLYKIKINPANW